MIALRTLRLATGITLDELRWRLEEISGHNYSRGTLSALETGKRGASEDILRQIEQAYGLPEGSVLTSYVPRAQRVDVTANDNTEAGAA